MRDFAQEFEQHARDVGMAEGEEKVHLVSALNQDTLNHLDTYIIMHGGDKIARLETIQNGLYCVPYV